MQSASSPQSQRFGLRLSSLARALPAVLALAAFAVPNLSFAQPNLLVAGGFEGISNPLDAYAKQTSAGVWGSESAAVSGAANGITPLGSQMLQLNHAGGGSAAQTSQIVRGPFKAGSVVTFSVKFNTWLTSSSIAPFPLQVAVSVGNAVLDSDPNTDNRSGPAVGSALVTLDTDTSTWQTATVTTTLTSDTDYLAAELYVKMYNNGAAFGTPLAYADDAVLTVIPPVYASGISPVTGYDPIFLDGPVPDYSESRPVPTVGYNDPRWTNPHAAIAFPLGTHPWESTVPYNFAANWINAWAGGGQLNQNPGLHSNLHGKTSSSPGWAAYPYYGVPDQSYTKYSTTVYGEGEYVLQFLADNVSWIYVDGALVGYQSYWWGTDGTGRYLITLNGAGAHDLGFVIWDGGGLAGGKFRLETKASFIANNPGVTLPPSAATVTLSNLTHTYDGAAKSATVTTSPSGLTTSVTYNGSPDLPIAAGSYSVVATVTSTGYVGSATGTLTIGKAPSTTTTIGAGPFTYDGTTHAGGSGTVTGAGNVTSSVFVTYSGDRVNAGTYYVTAHYPGDANHTASDGAAVAITINKANATVSVTGYTGVYDGAAHGAIGTATGLGGANLSAGLSLGASFTNAPGGTANWTFNGGTNYNNQSGSVAIVINKATATIAVNGYTGVYDGAAHGATGTAIGVNRDDLTSGLNLGASFTNAPGGTATWTFTGGTNYLDATGTAAINIAKANATVVVAPYSVTYDATAHSASVTSITGVAGETGAAVGTVNLNTTHTDAGTYADSWTFTGGTNYNDIAATAITNTIAKANATVSVNGYTGTYDGAAHGATGTAIGVARDDLSSGLNLGASFTNAPGGTAHWTFTGGTNYLDQSGDAVITIAKANASITVTGYSVTYDGNAHTATGSATGVQGEALSGLSLSATTHTNAGSTTDAWTFTDSTGNYNNATGTVADAIAKANASIVVTGYSVTYDGNAHTATGSATGVKGEALSGLSLAATTHTGAGNYTDAWTFTDSTGNYNNASGTAADAIAKAATKTVLGAVPAVSALGQSVTLSATVSALTSVVGSPDGSVTFTAGATTLGTATLTGGVATLATTAIPMGPQTIVATYSGSANFVGSNATSATSIIVYGYATGGGMFVIGDGNAAVGSAVTFWGAQWEKLNTLSGGTSNASFKGFAASTSGATFTAPPGNSAPPASGVPSYMAVIVTSKATKSGPNVTGPITRLVVVKTNPGYAPDPSYPGTGTVVAVIP